MTPKRCNRETSRWPGLSLAWVAWVAWVGYCGIAAGQGVEQPPGPGPLQVREVISWNDTGLEDRAGKSPDWIELANISDQTVDLTGYALSDNPDKPMKWTFPSGAGSLAPGARIVVFASGSPERSSGTEFHAGFKLGASGDVVLITGPDGLLNDAVEVLATTLPDVSQGRLAADPAQWRYFAKPTPGQSNPDEGFEAIAEPVVFSREAGYFADPFALELTGGPGDELRYTLDGDEPSELTNLYTAPVDVYDRSDEPNGISMIDGTSIANQHTNGWFPPRRLVPKAFSVRARAFRAGSLPGPIVTRTYFVGLDPATRWNLPVIALTSPPDGFFDYGNGIYMLGKKFDDFRAANPNAPLTGHTTANYTQRGAAWARAGHFEFFEPDGSLGIRQNVSLDIQGQSSRSFRQKSLGLKPLGDITPADTFEYPFFPGLQRRGLGGQRREFAGLRLRNSGNDWDLTMFRDALCHRLVAPIGIDVMTPRPVVVFLNGEFWGLYNLREQGDRESVEAHYGVPENDIVLAEADGRVKEGDPQGASSYRALRRLVDRSDLSDPDTFADVAARMDIDNFLHYQLAEIYLGNADWPHNNIRYWRGADPLDDPLSTRPGFDGRWRWMLFDADLAYAHPWTSGVGDATLAAAISPTGRPGLAAPWATALLRGLLENPGFRNDFINTMAGDLNSVFSDARAKSLVGEMKGAIEAVMQDQIDRWRTSGNSTVTWGRNVRVIEGFARRRPSVLRQQFAREFDLGGSAKMSVDVSPARAGIVTVHRLRLDSATPGVNAPVYPWEGDFFEDVPITVRADARPGYEFVRWDNGADDVATMETTLSDDAAFQAQFRRVQSAAPIAATGGEYHFDSWPAASPAGDHPPHIRFEQTAASSVGGQAGALMDSVWTGPYDMDDRSRFVGLDDGGIGLRDTGRGADFPGSGFPGAVVLALDTTELSGATVAWTAETLSPGQRASVIALQIAIGDGPYTDVIDAAGDPVRYTSADTSNVSRFAPVALPAAALGQPHIELRWRYHIPDGPGGSGALIRLDDISVIGSGSGGSSEITSVRWTSPNHLMLAFTGPADTEHILQWSSDLELWQDGESFTTTAEGSALLNLTCPEQPACFVRVARP